MTEGSVSLNVSALSETPSVLAEKISDFVSSGIENEPVPIEFKKKASEFDAFRHELAYSYGALYKSLDDLAFLFDTNSISTGKLEVQLKMFITAKEQLQEQLQNWQAAIEECRSMVATQAD